MIRLLHPELFQGNLKRRDYFEGWYLKHTDCAGQMVFALIPGVSLNPEDPHAFIQLIEGMGGETYYFRFPLDRFSFDTRRFSISIDKNHFSSERVLVDIKEGDFHFFCDLTYQELVPYPKSLLSPGIMGWYSFVPFMECHHGVVSMDHKVSGTCQLNEKRYSLENTRGYIEKDWGTSFPERWVWMQCNTFDLPDTSFMLSYATIPWLSRSFNGFLCFIYTAGRVHTFATYTKARIQVLSQENDRIKLICSDDEFELTITAVSDKSGSLSAPVKGTMTREIFESLTATIKLDLYDRREGTQKIITGSYGGLELCGAMV